MIITILLLLINYKAMLKVDKDTKDNYTATTVIPAIPDFDKWLYSNNVKVVTKLIDNSAQINFDESTKFSLDDLIGVKDCVGNFNKRFLSM